MLLTTPRGTFAFEDITGMAWIEIDFAADIERATRDILPRVLASEGHARATTGRDDNVQCLEQSV